MRGCPLCQILTVLLVCFDTPYVIYLFILGHMLEIILPRDFLPKEMADVSLMYCCFGNMSEPLLNNCIFVFQIGLQRVLLLLILTFL